MIFPTNFSSSEDTVKNGDLDSNKELNFNERIKDAKNTSKNALGTF